MNGRARIGLGAVGVVGASVAIAVGLLRPGAFVEGYLAGAAFAGGLPLGAVVLLCMLCLAGGRWGRAMRAVAGPLAGLVVAVPLVCAPVLLGLGSYPWAGEAGGLAEKDAEVVAHWGAWMSPWAAVVRTAAVMALWIGLGLWAAGRIGRRGAGASGVWAGLGATGVALSVSLVSIDWILSRHPGVPASMFGLTVFTAMIANALSVVVLVAAVVLKPGEGVLRDLGALLLAALVLDLYTAFSQFFIVWNGNLPQQVAWYVPRFEGGWLWLTVGMAVLRYAVPVTLLISGRVKRRAGMLAGLAGVVLVGGALQAVWQATPTMGGPVLAPLAIALGTEVALAGLIGAAAWGRFGSAARGYAEGSADG